MAIDVRCECGASYLAQFTEFDLSFGRRGLCEISLKCPRCRQIKTSRIYLLEVMLICDCGQHIRRPLKSILLEMDRDGSVYTHYHCSHCGKNKRARLQSDFIKEVSDNGNNIKFYCIDCQQNYVVNFTNAYLSKDRLNNKEIYLINTICPACGEVSISTVIPKYAANFVRQMWKKFAFNFRGSEMTAPMFVVEELETDPEPRKVLSP